MKPVQNGHSQKDLLSLLEVYKCCILGKITYNNSLCNLSSIKKTAFNDFKEGFVNSIRKKKDSQKGNNLFGVGPVLGG